MTSDPLKDFDFFADDAYSALHELQASLNTELVALRRALADSLPPEQRQQFFDLLGRVEVRGRVEGAQYALKHFKNQERQAELDSARTESLIRQNASLKEQNHLLRKELQEAKKKPPRTEQEETLLDLKSEIGSLRKSCELWKERAKALENPKGHTVRAVNQKLLRQISRKDALINRLHREIKDAFTWAEIQAEYAEFIPEPEPTPTWDYAPIKRRRALSGEHPITAPAFGVETAARSVEEFVRKHGGTCSKADVSAAMPHLTCLSDAYKHLHASRRVRVDGMRLTLWPT